MNELILACRYILTRDVEIGSFVGVAYKLSDDKVKTELLLGTNSSLSVQVAGQATDDAVFTVDHIFVERYINTCVRKPLENIDIFRFYLSRGHYPERPEDMQGELYSHFQDSIGNDIWTSYEHISGPYLADPQYITSAFSANRLDDLLPIQTTSLILDKASYKRNPQDIPILGVVLAEDEATSEQKYLEDLCLRTKQKKPTYIN